MGILKWALYGGAAYLGYKALTKPTVDDIVEAAKLRLDPKLAWTIVHYVSTDTWSIAGFSSGQAAATAQSPMFTNAHDVLAWLKASPLTGSTANVTFNLGT